MKKHYNIPFFIPHEGCPFTCIFCSQRKISGHSKAPSIKTISGTIKKYTRTISSENAICQVAFFGGSFTAIPFNVQERYLKAVQPFIKQGLIDSIRISTRPDFINRDELDLLRSNNVTNIELGVQSLSDRVLKSAKRGHTAADVAKASRLILKYGFTLGHQMMVGLPGSSMNSEVRTARMSVEMGAREVRIYPVIVIRGTGLEKLWREGLYTALTEEEAIKRSARLMNIFNKNKVNVLRLGIHPSEGLLSGRDILAGPFHPAFAQKVSTYIYGEKLRRILARIKDPCKVTNIFYNIRDGAEVIGYERANVVYVESVTGKRNLFKPSPEVRRGEITVTLIER